MTVACRDDAQNKRNVLEYLNSLQLLVSDLDIYIQGPLRSGRLYVRQGKVIGATCSMLRGNGALLSLSAQGEVIVESVKSTELVDKNVSLTLSQVAELVTKVASISSLDNRPRDEEQLLQEAISLFFQFRRKEAGAILIEILRANRFFYPAWLWQSRLMTRVEYIQKALNEAKKWGNSDTAVLNEESKILTQLPDQDGSFRRCLYCWAPVVKGDSRCSHCRGYLTMVDIDPAVKPAGNKLRQSLSLYEEEWAQHDNNSRIAYCLGLGYRSLGEIGLATEFLQHALELAPKEPLFLRSLAMLQKIAQRPPVPAVHSEKPAKKPAIPTKFNKSEGHKNNRILVVEDSKTSRKVISLVLHRKGYTVKETTTGAEALESLKAEKPDLVLLDVMLPDMTGYEILSEIRKDDRLTRVPVVMLTGKKGASDRLKGMVGGANEYLTKPFDPAKLLGVMERFLEHVPEQTDRSAIDTISKTKQAVVVPKRPLVSSRRSQPQFQPKVMEKRPSSVGAKSVLVVEDSPTARRVISMVLKRKGYQVREAETGKQAMTLLRDATPNLILLDAILPDMTGYDILGQLKGQEQLSGIPVIMLTSKKNPMDREKGLRAGSVAYLTKPFDPGKLLSVIEKHIAHTP